MAHREESSEFAPEIVGSGAVVCPTVKLQGVYAVTFVIDAKLDDPIGRTIVEHQQYPVGATSELMMHLLRPGHTRISSVP